MLYVNPDGHEWKRAKWPAPVRKYWKISEKLMDWYKKYGLTAKGYYLVVGRFVPENNVYAKFSVGQ